MVEISPDLACFCRIWSDFFVALVGSGCSGFGDANPSLDPPVSVFENGNPPPTYWTFGSGRNRVVVGRFGRVVGLRSGLDSPSTSIKKQKEECDHNTKQKDTLMQC